MIVGAPAERPVIFPLAFLDRKIVDAGDAQAHQPLLVELPVLVAVAAEPVAAIVVPLVGEAYRDAVLAERPDLLDQPVVELSRPLPCEDPLYLAAPAQESRGVAPATVDRIGERNARRLARVPGILRHA